MSLVLRRRPYNAETRKTIKPMDIVSDDSSKEEEKSFEVVPKSESMATIMQGPAT